MVAPELEHLRLDECLRLLARQQVGRLAFVVGDQPLIVPVNYAVAGDIVVFRTAPGTKLGAAPSHKVAFEVDSVDPEARSGWSVVVQGVAEEMTDAPDGFSDGLRRAAAPVWAPGPKDHYLRIIPHLVSGRRFRRPVGSSPAAAGTPRGS